MKQLIKIIGVIVFASAMYMIPILLTCSLAFEWDGFWQMILWIASGGQLLVLCCAIYERSEMDE